MSLADSKRLQNRSVLITGGANGAGAASARLFAEEGARVMIADRDVEAAEQLVRSLAAQSLEVRFVRADVSRARAAFGAVDVLFNHAGIIIVKPFLECTLSEWDELMDNNAKSAFLMSRLVIPEMLERGRGVLIFTSTTGVRAATGCRCRRGSVGQAAASASASPRPRRCPYAPPLLRI